MLSVGLIRWAGSQLLDEIITLNSDSWLQVDSADNGADSSFDVNVGNSSPAYATNDGITFVGPPQGWPPVKETLTVIGASERPGSSGQAAIDAGDLVIPCFTTGPRIDTPKGPVPVKTLAVGDLICTRESQFQPIRWIGSISLKREQLSALSDDSRHELFRLFPDLAMARDAGLCAARPLLKHWEAQLLNPQ